MWKPASIGKTSPFWGRALLLLLLFAAGCASGSSNLAQTETTEHQGQQPGFSIPLPTPSELAPNGASPRTTSYEESDLYRPGKFYDAGLPSNNVGVPVGDAVIFSPAWQAGGGTDGLAYCMYSFPAFGFDRELTLHYSFSSPPADWGTIWMGAADFGSNRWVWRAAEPDGALPTLLTVDTFSGDGTVYVVFACTANGDTPALEWTHLGPPQVTAKIQTFIHSGVAPLSVNADASASSAGNGEIALYEWDWDGDGEFDDDTGDAATSSHVYDTPGEYAPTVRVTSSLGASATASTSMKVVGPWVHTWGLEYEDVLVDSSAGTSGDLYFCGSTRGQEGGQKDALLLKYDLDGNLAWARTTGEREIAGTDVFTGVHAANDGTVYAVGMTNSDDAGDFDVLLQKWDQDGTPLWTKIWGSSEYENVAASTLDGGYLYVVGNSDANVLEDGPPEMLIARFSLDGELDWANTYSIAYGVYGQDIEVVSPPFGDVEVHVGGYKLDIDDNQSLYYGVFNETGEAQTSRYWQSGEESRGARLAVLLFPERRVYVCGTTLPAAGEQELLLAEYADSGMPPAKSWVQGPGARASAYGIVQTRDGIVIAGHAPLDDSSFLLYTDASLELNAAVSYSPGGPEPLFFRGVASFPGRGVLAYGEAPRAGTVERSELTMESRSIFGTWQTVGVSSDALSQTSYNWTPTILDANGGTIDSGGGGADGLLLAAPQM